MIKSPGSLRNANLSEREFPGSAGVHAGVLHVRATRRIIRRLEINDFHRALSL